MKSGSRSRSSFAAWTCERWKLAWLVMSGKSLKLNSETSKSLGMTLEWMKRLCWCSQTKFSPMTWHCELIWKSWDESWLTLVLENFSLASAMSGKLKYKMRLEPGIRLWSAFKCQGVTTIHVQGQCLVPMVSSENLYWGCCKFSELSHCVGIYTDNLCISKLSYNSILNLHFAMHYLNNPVID